MSWFLSLFDLFCNLDFTDFYGSLISNDYLFEFYLNKSLEGELHGVPNQIIQDLSEPPRVGIEVRRDFGIDLIHEIDTTDFCSLWESDADRLHELSDLDFLIVHHQGFFLVEVLPGEVENIIDQAH